MAYNLLGSRLTYWVGSGGSSTSGPDIRGTGKTYYDQTAEDLANNRSRIKVEYGDVVNVGLYTSYTLTVRIQKKVGSNWENVQTKTYNQSSGNISAGTHIRGNLADVFIPHDSTGSAQVRTYITITDTGAFNSSQSFMYVYDLPQISQQTQAGSLLLIVGQTSVYEINPMSPNYTHSLKITFKGNTYYVGQNGVLTNTEYIFSGTSTNVVCPTSFYALFTTVTDYTGSITLKTYNGSTQVGQETTGVLEVDVSSTECTPQITGTVADTNSTTIALTGSSSIIVPYYSQVRVTPIIQPSAVADTNTTLTIKAIDNVGYSGSYYDAPTAKLSYEIKAKNSREMIAIKTLSASSILDYTKPTVNASSKFNRTSPTADNMYVSFSGTFWNKNFGAISNTLTVKWYVKEKSSSTYTLGGTFTQGTDYTVSGNNYSATNKQLTCPLTGGWSYNKAYDFKIEATDRLGSETLVTSVNKGKPIFYWYEKNNTNYFKVNGTLSATDLKIGNGGLLDLIYPVGSIYVTSNSSFNPNTTFGGTWTPIKDKFILAAGDTYTNGSTGGSADLQAHTHTMAADFYIRHGNTAGTDIVAEGTNTTITTGAYSSTWGNGIYTSSYSHKPDKVAISGNTGSTGNGNGGNMPPYIVKFVWERTA